MHIHTQTNTTYTCIHIHIETHSDAHTETNTDTHRHTVCNNSFNKEGLQWVVCTYIVNIKLNNKIITVSGDGMD